MIWKIELAYAVEKELKILVIKIGNRREVYK